MQDIQARRPNWGKQQWMTFAALQTDSLKEARDALEQAQQLQRVTADTVTQQDELLNMYSERIVELEAALIETDNGKIRCCVCKREAYSGEEIFHKESCVISNAYAVP